MDDTTTSAQHSTAAIDMMGPITVVHIVLMIVLAAAAIAVIWWGGVLRRRRRGAEDQVAHNREVAEEAGATAPPAVQSGLSEDAPATAVPAAPESAIPSQPEQAPAPAPTPDAASELTQLKGLGPKLATTFADLGYTRIEQIAALTPGEAETLDAKLGAFQGRMARDRWIEQAKLLTAGDRAGYEAAFGKL
ncbi:hypothetical protein BH10PSE15_BH10PSE15_18430 [soil metagenome]